MKWSSITVPLLFVSCHTFKVKRKKNIYERHSKWIMWLAFVNSHLIWMSFKNCSELKYGVRKKSVYSCYWMIEKVIHSSFSINLNENIMFNQLRQHLCITIIILLETYIKYLFHLGHWIEASIAYLHRFSFFLQLLLVGEIGSKFA